MRGSCVIVLVQGPQCFYLHKLVICASSWFQSLLTLWVNFYILYILRTALRLKAWFQHLSTLFMEVSSRIPGWRLTQLLQTRKSLRHLLRFEIHSSIHLPGVWMYLVFPVWSAVSMYYLGPSTTSRTQYIQSMDFPKRAFRAGRICRQPRQRVPVPRLRQDGHLELHRSRWSLRCIACSNCCPTIC